MLVSTEDPYGIQAIFLNFCSVFERNNEHIHLQVIVSNEMSLRNPLSRSLGIEVYDSIVNPSKNTSGVHGHSHTEHKIIPTACIPVMW